MWWLPVWEVPSLGRTTFMMAVIGLLLFLFYCERELAGTCGRVAAGILHGSFPYCLGFLISAATRDLAPPVVGVGCGHHRGAGFRMECGVHWTCKAVSKTLTRAVWLYNSFGINQIYIRSVRTYWSEAPVQIL